MILLGWVLWVRIVRSQAGPSTVPAKYFLGGLQLVCLGGIGAFIGKNCGEVKSGPRYFIDRTIGLTFKPKPIR